MINKIISLSVPTFFAMSLHTDAYCKALVLVIEIIIKIIIIMEDRRHKKKEHIDYNQ